MNTMEYINSFSKSGERVTNLSRISGLLNDLGNPQKNLKFVHIAGTNGKGSTLELCSQAVINSGYMVGQFTSPYIKSYEDRIRINGVNIPMQTLDRLCNTVKRVVKSKEYSQFEITFAIALLYYLESNCDIVFLETGIGGLLDATNIIKNPLVAVITSISYDHIGILGNSMQEIATHKAGIIKQNCPTIISVDNDKEALDLIVSIADKKKSKLIMINPEYISVLGYGLNGSFFKYKSVEYNLKMLGKHQIYNACTAIETLNLLKKHDFNISDEAIKMAFENVQVGARLEVFDKNPLVILDGGHNIGGVLALTDMLKSLKKHPIIAVIGMITTKNYVEVAELFSKIIDIVICVDGFTDSNLGSKKLAEHFPKHEKYSMDYHEGFIFAKDLAIKRDGIVLVCGSLYLSSAIINIREDKDSQE